MSTLSDEWTDLAVCTLLDCYRDVDNSRGALRAKGWQDLVDKLNAVCAEGRAIYSYRRCKNKMDVMKRRYKHERIKELASGTPSDWPWYKRMDEIVGIHPPKDLSFCTQDLVARNSAAEQLSYRLQEPTTQKVTRNSAEQLSYRLQDPTTQKASTLKNVACFQGLDKGIVAPIVLQQEINHQQGTNTPSSASDILNQVQNSSPVSKSSSLLGVSNEGIRKRKSKCSSRCSECSAVYTKEVTRTITQAFEEMEMRKLDLMKELEMKRCEMQLQIAKMIISSNGYSNYHPAKASDSTSNEVLKRMLLSVSSL